MKSFSAGLLTACSLLVVSSVACAEQATTEGMVEVFKNGLYVSQQSLDISGGKAYSLTEVFNINPDNIPDDVIVKYDFDKSQNKITPRYFKITLVSEYDVTDGKTGITTGYKYFEWVENSGNRFLKEVKNIDPLKPAENYIKVKYQTVYGDTASEKAQYFQWNFGTNVTFDNVEQDTAYDVVYYGESLERLVINSEEDIAGKTVNGNITGDFVGNQLYRNESTGHGAGIYNGANLTLGDITGNFIGNGVQTNNGEFSSGGGAGIFNSEGATIGNIKGDFVGNYAYNDTGNASIVPSGAAIENNGTIGNIDGNFIGNYIYSDIDDTLGAAIANRTTGVIGDITGNFIGNYAYSSGDDNDANSGAIRNFAKIGNIKGDFIGNYAIGGMNAYGGASRNTGTIKSITGNFIGNYIRAKNGEAIGGAIYSYSAGNITSITGDFVGNNAISEKGSAFGGAIYNKAFLGNIDGNFYSNYVVGKDAQGGAVGNVGSDTIQKIKGDFIQNHATGTNGYGYGGALYNEATVTSVEGSFYNNYVNATTAGRGGAIYNKNTINNISGDFVANRAEGGSKGGFGGAIQNEGSIEGIIGDFYANYAQTQGGAVFNTSSTGKIGSLTSTFINNRSGGSGGAVYNDEGASIGSVAGIFYGNAASGDGGAIYNVGEIGGSVGRGIVNSSFYNNTAGEHGGAIYTETDLSIISDGSVVEFSGNSAGANSNEAIYVASENALLTLEAQNGGKFVLMDKINGVEGYGVELTASDEQSASISLNNDIQNADISHDGDNLVTTVSKASFLNNNNSLAMNSGTLNVGTLGADEIHFREFDVMGGVINVASTDVDLANEHMGRFTADGYDYDGGVINLNGMRVLSDGKELVTYVPFADETIAGSVHSDISSAYGPIYKYDVAYWSDSGEFSFTREEFNPAVETGSAAELAGGYASMLQAYEYAFEHADAFSGLPRNEDMTDVCDVACAAYYGILPEYYAAMGRRAGWIKPYATFETMPLKNGPKVHSKLYGTLIGADSNMIYLGNGWHGNLGAYLGYSGAVQKFDGNKTTQRGGLVGLTETFYHGNFYTALTESVAYMKGDTTTMFGKEHFRLPMGGIASKTGYNVVFENGKYIIQPNILLSYTLLKPKDYTAASGVRMHSKTTDIVQVNPHVKFIYNMQEGWQPYAVAGMVYNIGKTDVTADGTELPELSIKPYAEYGGGIQKYWNDSASGYGQVLFHSGGRRGAAFTAGFRYAF